MATFDLFSAVKDGDTDSVRTLLTSRRCRSHLNDRNEWGDTVLHLASEAGNSEVCQMLIAGGASVTVRNNRGETCLHRAAVGGHTDCVTAIVERDNDPEAVNSQNDAGYTALHHAAKHGTIDLIQVLLRYGADRMLENNAGETPYMVAHKYQQFEAERLLLNIEQQHADKAIQEMNSKPKKIIAAYSKALKNAHKPESRIRLILAGDSQTGKTSLKKTLFGEPFDLQEEPTRCIHAEPSIARIQFRQYREWVIQPSSKADAHRLNLEYTDAIIDYILNEIRKPGVSDEVVDLKKLGLRKQTKNVNFESTPSIIPMLSLSTEVCDHDVANDDSPLSSEKYSSDESNETPPTNGTTEETPPTSKITESTDDVSGPSRGRQGTIVGQQKPQEDDKEPLVQSTSKSKLTVFESTLEMSKSLLEHIPLEVLKRLVMRWPVNGEDSLRDQESLSRRRLLIHVWDCSGDPMQLSVVPLFFTSRSIFLVTYNLTNDLHQPAQSFLSHKLTNLQGSCPTNAEVLGEWLGSISAQTSHLPTGPTHPSPQSSPQLPPIIFVTPFGDRPHHMPFSNFFASPSYNGYKHHLLEANYISVSNQYASELSDDYTGHHFLHREIDHLARQMPYIYDMVPVQWVKFEQLLHSLLEQKKVIIQLRDLERYIAERCDIIGPLQVQPVLSYFNDIGVIIHFHRHPALAPLIVIKPQWLLDSLASVFASSSTKWITTEVRLAFQKLLSEGSIRREVLLLAYRCARLPQRYWNETLYFMNYMDLIACHGSLHESTSVYVPGMVNQAPPAFSFGPTGNDPATLFFSCGVNTMPLALFNQLVVRCIRSCRFPPTLYHDIVHFRLNQTHHLILRREGTCIRVLVQSDTERFCSHCRGADTSYPVTAECSHLTHIIDHEKDITPGEHLEEYQLFISQLPQNTLDISDTLVTLQEICPKVLCFLQETLNFLTSCWYPGLLLELATDYGLNLDRKWRRQVLDKGSASEKLTVWFS